jgi:hypothetical protein
MVGRVWAWGGNAAGTLGDGTFNSRTERRVVEGLPPIARISAGARHSLAIDMSGRVWGWGAQESGQLCNKSRADAPGPEFSLRPTLLATPAAGVASAQAAGSRSLFLGQDGTVSVCGASAQLAVCHDVRAADGAATTSRQVLPTLLGSTRIFAQREASYSIGPGGRVASCGSNEAGELGKGALSGAISTPAYISTLENIIEGAAGDRFAVVVRRDGAVFAWGENSLGQLGVATVGQGVGNPSVVRTLAGALNLGLDLLADPDSDGAPNSAELEAGTDPFVADNTALREGDAGYALFARQQTRDLLMREATQAEAGTAAARISNLLVTRAGVVDEIVRGEEYDRATGAIGRLYFATYQRVPDAGGQRFWTQQLRRGTSLEQIASQFATAPEFEAIYGSLSNRQYVEQLYQNVLGRPGDSGGIVFWTGQIDANATSRGGLLAAFSESAEFKARAAIRVAVCGVFSGMLQRAPSQAEFEAWVVDVAARGSVVELADATIRSGEYARRFAP